MKNIASVITFAIVIIYSGHSRASGSCEARRASLERELNISQQYSNMEKIAGLREALENVNRHCTPESVKADKQHEIHKLQDKIREKQGDIRRLQEDLYNSNLKGDDEKAAKYRRKIEEKKNDIAAANLRINSISDE